MMFGSSSSSTFVVVVLVIDCALVVTVVDCMYLVENRPVPSGEHLFLVLTVMLRRKPFQ